jgi:hypothetical protein
MKHCPICNRAYTDAALNFCLEDGSPLVIDAAPASEDTNPTVLYPAPPDTNPPPTQLYGSGSAFPDQPPLLAPPQWSPTPQMQPPKKSKAIWWILGVVVFIGFTGVGLVVVLIVIGAMSAASNTNRSVNISSPNANRNSNTNRSNVNSPNANTNSSRLPSSFRDDFSTRKWDTGSSEYGELWYADDQYHMRSKDKTYFMMYGPSNDYNTENATVLVTVRNVDGVSPTTGYGLVVHCAKLDEKFEYYSFLIYSGDKPQYKVAINKGGTETALVSWTPSNAIRSGTNTNQLEVRIKGDRLAFYINSQYLTSITDTGNFRRGVAGFYASGAHEVAFDDLEITR